MTLKERIAQVIDEAKDKGHVHSTCSTAAVGGVVYTKEGDVVGYAHVEDKPSLAKLAELARGEEFLVGETQPWPDSFNLTPAERAIKEERQGEYGDPLPCHQAIADAWNGIVRQTMQRATEEGWRLTPYDVALMFVAAKTIRLAFRFKQDSLDDLLVYAKFAEGFAKEEGQ